MTTRLGRGLPTSTGEISGLGVREFHLLGTAMGAIVALKAAAVLADRLQTLVLCDPTDTISARAHEYILRRAETVTREGMRSVTDASLANAFRGMDVNWDDPQWATYRHHYLANAPHSYALHSEALVRLRFGGSEFRQVVCPTLILTGGHDFVWPPEDGRRLAAKLPSARFQELPQSSHFPPLQSPKDVVAAIESFWRTAGS